MFPLLGLFLLSLSSRELSCFSLFSLYPTGAYSRVSAHISPERNRAFSYAECHGFYRDVHERKMWDVGCGMHEPPSIAEVLFPDYVP